MKRVVITGLGIVSCIGNDKTAVLESLKTGKSGIPVSANHMPPAFQTRPGQVKVRSRHPAHS